MFRPGPGPGLCLSLNRRESPAIAAWRFYGHLLCKSSRCIAISRRSIRPIWWLALANVCSSPTPSACAPVGCSRFEFPGCQAHEHIGRGRQQKARPKIGSRPPKAALVSAGSSEHNLRDRADCFHICTSIRRNDRLAYEISSVLSCLSALQVTEAAQQTDLSQCSWLGLDSRLLRQSADCESDSSEIRFAIELVAAELVDPNSNSNSNSNPNANPNSNPNPVCEAKPTFTPGYAKDEYARLRHTASRVLFVNLLGSD